MTYSYFWLTTGLASMLALTLLATATCLFLLRRMDGLVRSHDAVEQRVVQLAYELRRLEAAFSSRDPRVGGRPAQEPDSLISVPDLAIASATSTQAGRGLAEKHADVWALVEAGRSAQEIAQETGRPIGQVEMIVGLYREHLAALARGPHAGSP